MSLDSIKRQFDQRSSENGPVKAGMVKDSKGMPAAKGGMEPKALASSRSDKGLDGLARGLSTPTLTATTTATTAFPSTGRVIAIVVDGIFVLCY